MHILESLYPRISILGSSRISRIVNMVIRTLSWYDLPSHSLPTFGHLQPLPPPLHSNSEAYLHNLCNCIVPTLGLTADQYRTHSDLVPMPRATIYIPFLHLSYLPDPFSLTIMGNYSFLV